MKAMTKRVHPPYKEGGNLRDTSCDDELRTAGNAEFVLNQNLNTKSTELISVLIIEDHVDANPGAESELGKAAESRGFKNHEIGLQQSKVQTYGNKYMGETTSDDEKEDIEKTSSDSKNHVENTSSDDKGEDNMINIVSKSEHGQIDDTRKDLMINGKVTQRKVTDPMEYLDDVTYFVTLDTKEDTSLTSGHFIDTNRLLNKVEPKKTLPSAHGIPQQRSDDPRRGGRVGEVWSKDTVETRPNYKPGNIIEAHNCTPSNVVSTSTDELKTAGNAEFVLSQNLNTKSTELISVLIIEDHVDANPGVESELDEAAESRGIKNHEIGLQQSKAHTYGNRHMGETTSDDEEEDIQKTSSDSRNNMENTSSDDKGENNMIKYSLFKDRVEIDSSWISK